MNLINMQSDTSRVVAAIEYADTKLRENDIKGAIIFARKVQYIYPQVKTLFEFLGNISVHVFIEETAEEIDWYSVLGVHPLADYKLIKRSYYELAMVLDPIGNKPFGSFEVFKILDHAWRILANKDRREEYDDRRSRVHHNEPFEYPAVSAGVSLPETPFNIGNICKVNYKMATSINRTAGARNPGSSSADIREIGARGSEICGNSHTIFAHQPSHTFWTACDKCGTPYQCPQYYIKRFIFCHQCHSLYLAVVHNPQPGRYNVSGNIRSGSQVISSATHSRNQTTAVVEKASYIFFKQSAQFVGSSVKDPKESMINFAHHEFVGSSVKDPKESMINFAHHEFVGSSVKDPKESMINFAHHEFAGSSVKDQKKSMISFAHQYAGSSAKDPKKSRTLSTRFERASIKNLIESRRGFALFAGSSVNDPKKSCSCVAHFAGLSIKDPKESTTGFASFVGSSVRDLKKSRTGFGFFAGSGVKDLKLKEKMSSNEDVCGPRKNVPPSHMAVVSAAGRQGGICMCQLKDNSLEERGGVSGTSKGKRALDVNNGKLLEDLGRKVILKKLNEMRAAATSNNEADKETPNENPGDPEDYMEDTSTEGSGEDVVMTMQVPDSDFYNFDSDRIETSFGENQVWAAYDKDGMPRLYGLIQNVSISPFKMKINWLNSRSNTDLAPINWISSGFAKTCGKLWVTNKVSNKEMNSFSHMVTGWTKMCRTILIFPKKGDVWALYRNWSPNWNELTTYEERHAFDIVEVVQDYNEEQGVTVVPLVKVAGFKCVFCRHAQEPRRIIQRAEIFRFSHQVTYQLLTGEEAANIPKGSKELDPAALSSELLQVIT